MATMRISALLEDIYFAAAKPRIVAGAKAAERPIRWVHATEQLDIAPLLRGNELILMEGVNLRECEPSRQEAYLDDLHGAGVAGLAIETNDFFPLIPPSMARHAEAIGFPVIELRRRVPFVQICESVNSQLADSSLRRLQLADQMSMALSSCVRDVVGIYGILQVLARETRSDVVVTSLAGKEIGRAGHGDASGIPVFTAPVSFGGTVVATLSLRPAADADIYLISAALERAPDVLAIALLNLHPPSPEERMKTQFISLMSGPVPGLSPEDRPQWDALADRLDFDPRHAYLVLLVSYPGAPGVPEVADILSGICPSFIGQLMGTEFTAVLDFPDWDSLERGRTRLASLLGELALRRPEDRICLGPGARTRSGIPRCLAAAVSTLEIAGGAGAGSLLDAREFAVPRLRHATGQDKALQEFVDEQIGALLRRDAELSGELFDTLVAYAEHWGSKTETAKALSVQRQTLYQRLDKVFAAIGPLPAGSPRIPGILAAVFLEKGRRQLKGAPDTSGIAQTNN